MNFQTHATQLMTTCGRRSYKTKLVTSTIPIGYFDTSKSLPPALTPDGKVLFFLSFAPSLFHHMFSSRSSIPSLIFTLSPRTVRLVTSASAFEMTFRTGFTSGSVASAMTASFPAPVAFRFSRHDEDYRIALDDVRCFNVSIVSVWRRR